MRLEGSTRVFAGPDGQYLHGLKVNGKHTELSLVLDIRNSGVVDIPLLCAMHSKVTLRGEGSTIADGQLSKLKSITEARAHAHVLSYL
jgi:hypothetical protein